MQVRKLSLVMVLLAAMLSGTKNINSDLLAENTTKKELEMDTWQNVYEQRMMNTRDTVEHLVREVDVIIPFETISEDDDTYPIGQTYVKQSGIVGIRKDTYEDTFEGVILRRSVLIDSVVSVAVQNKIIGVGTKVESQKTHTQYASSEPNAPTIPNPSGTYYDGMAYDMYNAINDYRSQQGVGSISWSSQLESYAKIRASELEFLFDHARPDGSAWDSLNPDVIYAENIAMRAYRVQTAMDGFIASSTHQSNMLADYPYVAIAVYEGSDGESYWVQLFGY